MTRSGLQLFAPLVAALLVFAGTAASAQVRVDLNDVPASRNGWRTHERVATGRDSAGRYILHLDDGETRGLAWNPTIEFVDGEIDVDVRGRNVKDHSFVGVAFRVTSDTEYDAVYVRPFNFLAPDSLHHAHGMQYIGQPEAPWARLRAEHPGGYEAPLPVDPDSWVHLHLVVRGTDLRVYVNHASTPSLHVQTTGARTRGGIGLFVAEPSSGDFSNLTIVAEPPRRTALPGAVALDSTTPLELNNARAQWVEYRGRPALKLAPLAGHERDVDTAMVALLPGSEMRDGVIEVDVAGARRAGYSTAEDVSGFKGIIGISFRVRGDTAERFYLRPENSRVNNQLFRNRSTQYEASPGFSWQRLRADEPGVYESYVDLEPGAWTTIRIEVVGTRARLFVNGAEQPALVVNDLKTGDHGGQVALWARISTEAYFSRLRIEPHDRDERTPR